SLVARLEEIPRSQIEYAAGHMVVQYRGHMLPLILLAKQLGSETESLPDVDNLQVGVFTDGASLVGLIVDSIMDITQEQVTTRRTWRRPGIMGSAFVGRRLTDFVDLQEGVTKSGVKRRALIETDKNPPILVADKSDYSRIHIRSCLEMAGYKVLEAKRLED